jgi:hypothetical protein
MSSLVNDEHDCTPPTSPYFSKQAQQNEQRFLDHPSISITKVSKMPPVQPSFLLAPNFHFGRDGPIKLGSIIADPFTPQRYLTTLSENSNLTKYTVQDSAPTFTSSSNRSKAISAWANLLEVASAKAAASCSNGVEAVYTMKALETVYFDPNEIGAEIQERVKDGVVRDVLKGNLGGSPVYMITGLKIAKGFVESSFKTDTREREAEGSVDVGKAAQIGVQAEMGLSASIKKEKEAGSTWKASDDRIFAYQLELICVKGWNRWAGKGKVTAKEFRPEAAFLSKVEKMGEDEVLEIAYRLIGKEDLAEVDEDLQEEVINESGQPFLYYSLA